ncbi:MAG: tetratricopeptide repeat protein [Bacteroidales bacterium]
MRLRKGFFVWIFLGVLLLPESLAAQEAEKSSDYQYALIEAVKQKNLGNPAEAVKLYSLVIKEEPTCAVAHYELGLLYLMANQSGTAESHARKAYELEPGNRWYLLSYLNVLGVNESFDAMEKILRTKMKDDPEEVEWPYQLASVYLGSGKHGKAIRLLEEIEKQRGYSDKITLLKASVYESEKDFGAALKEIERILALFPEDLQLRTVAAELAMQDGDEDKAAGYYLEILAIDSTNIFALTNLTDHYRRVEDFDHSFYYMGRSFQSSQIEAQKKLAVLSAYLSDEHFITHYGTALENLLQIVLAANPEQHQVKLLAADFFIQKHRYPDAFFQLDSYLNVERGSYPMYMQALLLASASGLNSELVSLADRALVFFSDSSDIRFFKGIGCYETARYEALISNYGEMNLANLSRKEYVGQAKMLYAEALYRTGAYVVSDSVFEELIQEEPENSMVMNNYSYYLAERGEKLDLAKKLSSQTLQREPQNATYLDTYAWILYKRKEFVEAEHVILKALSLGGENDVEVNEHAAEIQRALGSKELARSYYLKALILGGDKESLESKMKDLDEKP